MPHEYCAMPWAFITDPAFNLYNVDLHLVFIRDLRLVEENGTLRGGTSNKATS